MTTLGLVLTRGGARAAYPAGALRALAEIADFEHTPFRVLAGGSAGAINAANLAAHADDFPAATRSPWTMWHGRDPAQVHRSDAHNLAAIGSRWIRDLGLGGLPCAGNIGRLAADPYGSFPRMLRYLPRGTDATGATGWDLLGYLTREPGYVDRLLELGHRDVMARKAEILAFLA